MLFDDVGFDLEGDVLFDLFCRLRTDFDKPVTAMEFDSWLNKALDQGLVDDEEEFYGDFLPSFINLLTEEFDVNPIYQGRGNSTQFSLSIATFYEYMCKQIYELELDGDYIWSAGDAMCNLGAAYYKGTLAVIGDKDKCIECYRKAIELGNMQAMINLGYLHQRGWFVEKDLDKAFKYYTKAYILDSNHPEACYRLGDMYYWGLGVEADPIIGFELYLQSKINLEDDEYGIYNDLVPSVLKRVAAGFEDIETGEYNLLLAYRIYQELEVYYLTNENNKEVLEDLLDDLHEKMDELRNQLM